MPAERSQLEQYITRRMAGEDDTIVSPVLDDGDPRYLAALEAERRAQLADGADQAEDAEPAQSLEEFTAGAVAAMGFPARPVEPASGQERWFEGLAEPERDAAWAQWVASLDDTGRALLTAGDPMMETAWQRHIEAGDGPRMSAIAAQIPGAKVVEDHLARPLRRFGR